MKESSRNLFRSGFIVVSLNTRRDALSNSSSSQRITARVTLGWDPVRPFSIQRMDVLGPSLRWDDGLVSYWRQRCLNGQGPRWALIWCGVSRGDAT